MKTFFLLQERRENFLILKTNDFFPSVFSEEEPDLNSELEISVRIHKDKYFTKYVNLALYRPPKLLRRSCPNCWRSSEQRE